MGVMPALLDRARARAASVRADDAARQAARPLTLSAVLAALWTFAVGLGVCVGLAAVGWVVGSTGTVWDAGRVGAQAWLLAHGAGLDTDGATVTAVPLGLTLLVAWVLYRAASAAARAAHATDLRAAGAGAAVITSVYAVSALGAALLSATDEFASSPVRAFVGGLVLGLLPGGLGMLRGSGLLAPTWIRLDEHVRAAVHGAAAGVVTMVAVGALLVTVALVSDFGDAANIAQSIGAGVVGGAILTAAGALLLPNAALLAMAYTLGPGFAFGADTTVAPSGVVLGRVPAFPLLAALPDAGVGPAWGFALLAVPVLAGVLAAFVALRHHPVDRLDLAALRGASAGVLAGAVTGLLTGAAGGSIGPGRMAETGAPVLACLVAALVAMGLGGAVGGPLLAWRMRRRDR